MLFQLPFGLFFIELAALQKGNAKVRACLHKTSICGIYSSTIGGVLASTHRQKRGRHVEDGSLASLKTEPNKINADHEDLALAA